MATPPGGIQIVGALVADVQIPFGDRLQPGDHAQQNWICRSRRADDDEFPCFISDPRRG